MSNELNKLVTDIRFNAVLDKPIDDQIGAVYSLGYNAGVTDQKKFNKRTKFRYNVLLGWYEAQLNKLSLFTKRPEYRSILDGICDQADQYKFENNLSSSYKPKVFSFVDGEGEEVIVDAKERLQYTLTDVVGDFIKGEDLKQERERERLLNKQNNNE